MIATFALVVVAVALVCAGLYGLLGKPSTHTGKKRKQHVVNGFRVGGGILLGFALMTILIGSSQIAFGIVHSTKLSRFFAFLLWLGSLALILSMIQLWAKYFAGWIGYSVLNGLFMMSSGHLVNNPAVLVPRWWSTSATTIAFASVLVCLRLNNTYLLKATDRAALMTWLLIFTFAVDIESSHSIYREELGMAAMFVGCLAFVLAWWYDREAQHHRHRTPQMQHPAGRSGT